MTTPPFEDQPPDNLQLMSYDERHLVTYLRLLDADKEGADWREVVQVIFGLDPTSQPERARLVHASHLARARWLTDTASRDLLRSPLHRWKGSKSPRSRTGNPS